jgi:hypothetical protein
MTFYPVRGLGKGGVVADKLPWELEPNSFTNVSNVSFNDSAAYKTPGYQKTIDVGPGAVWMQLYDDGTAKQLVYATGTDLFLLQSGAWINVGTGYTSSTNWHSDSFGTFCIFNNGIEKPQSKAVGANFIDLPGWPATWTCGLIRAYKDFLVAAQVVDNGIEQRNTIYWSDAAPTNELPENWTPGSPSLAGFVVIPGDGGEVVEMVPLGDSMVIYTQAAMYALTFTGSALRPMTLRRLPIAYGAASRECVVPFESGHFVIGLRQLYVHDTVNAQLVAEEIVEERFYRELSNIDQVQVVQNARDTEIIVAYSDRDTIASDKALTWNWLDNTWSFWTLPGVTCISYAFAPTEGETWETISTQWNANNAGWNELTQKVEALTLFYLTDTELFQALTGTTADGEPISAFVEKLGWDLDSIMQEPTNRRKMIRSIYPQIRGSGQANFFVGFSNAPNGAVNWKGPILLDLDEQPKRYKIDAIGHARYLSFRMEHNDVGSFRLSGMELDLMDSYQR